MSRGQFSKSILEGANETVRKLNPELFGVGGLQSQVHQPHPRPALDSQPQTRKASRGRISKSGPVLRVALVSCRRRLIADRSNFDVGFKQLQDSIARFFDLDDEDGTIAWEYHQVATRGAEGTIVKIEKL